MRSTDELANLHSQECIFAPTQTLLMEQEATEPTVNELKEEKAMVGELLAKA